MPNNILNPDDNDLFTFISPRKGLATFTLSHDNAGGFQASLAVLDENFTLINVDLSNGADTVFVLNGQVGGKPRDVRPVS